GQAEHAPQTESARPLEQGVEQSVPEPRAALVLVHREGAHLREVLPHHVQRTAADDLAVLVGRDQELLHGLVIRDQVLAEQHPGMGHRLDEAVDAAHVGGQRGADRDAHTGLSSPRAGLSGESARDPTASGFCAAVSVAASSGRGDEGVAVASPPCSLPSPVSASRRYARRSRTRRSTEISRAATSASTTAAISATVIASRLWSANQAPAIAPIAQE